MTQLSLLIESAPPRRAPLPDDRELIVDSFAGGGGASLGIHMALGRGPDIAINHDHEAIALHAANHPESRHYAEDVWHVDPLEATGGRPVGLMWLSPDCKHFSKAKGGKPVSKRVRGLAWVAVRWAKAVRPRVMVLENVEEFETWGPIYPADHPDPKLRARPIPEKRGRTFRYFTTRLRNLGYQVEWRQLRACDFGAPTIRRRLFLIARCDGQPIVWPTPTHGPGREHPWRTAAECIDWSIPCPSIFERATPLAENTMRRIAAGIRRFVIESPRPFIVRYRGEPEGSTVSVDLPLPTVTANSFIKRPGGAAPLAVVVPSLVHLTHHGGDRVTGVDQPVPTVTGAHRGELGLVAPVLVPRYGEREGQAPRALAADQPMPTVVPTQNGASLVAAFMAKHQTERHAGEVQGSALSDPAPTVKTRDSNALVTLTMVPGEDHREQVRAFLVAYYGNEKDGGSLHDPMRTVTAKDRMGLVTVRGEEYVIADIGMRMLAPRELYRAQGFPDSYRIEIDYKGKPLTKTAQVKMCGNSVCPPLAAAIVRANLGRADEAQRVA